MNYAYPLNHSESATYSRKIRNYKYITLEEKKLLVNNFKEFQKYCWWWLGLPSPTRDQLYMGKYLSEGSIKKEPTMLQAQRGLAKSLVAEILTVWLLLRNKNEVIVIVSATAGRAESFTLFCLKLLDTVPILMHLAPSSDDRGSTRQFDVAGRRVNDSPSVKAFGVTSAKTGSRATYIIYDDVEIPENSQTAQKRQKILDGVRDTANLGIANVFRELCICTPQSSESVYDVLKNEDGFKRYIIPAEYPEDIGVYEGDLAKHIVRSIKRNSAIIGSATDKRNNMQHLSVQKLKGKARYKLHYMLDTTLTDIERYPLKLSDLIVLDLEPHKAPIEIFYGSGRKEALWDLKHKGFRGDHLYSPKYISENEYAEYSGIAMFIDPSGSGSDETAYCVTSHLSGKIFLLDFGGIQGGYGIDSLTELALIAKQYKVNLIRIESNFGDGSFAELLKPVVSNIYKTAYRGHHTKDVSGVAIEDVRATTNKERRIIETIEPIAMQHRLVVSKQALVRDQEKKADYSFTYQYTHITKENNALRHDDIVDVVEMGVSYWKQILAQNQEDKVKEIREDATKKRLEKFMEKAGVRTSKNVMDNL